MPVIAVVGNKGGAGKTTLAVNLAAGLVGEGSTALLDADPQRSSLQWRALAERDDAVAVFDAVDEPAAAIERMRHDYRYLVIDCPPSVAAPQTLSALRHSTHALIPVQPSPLDLWATVHIEGAVEAARETNPGLNAILVINQLEPRTRLSQMVRQGLAELVLPAAEVAIRRRIAYRTSILEGRSVHDLGQRGRAASEEIRQLIEEVILQ
jgi:chromosome partitioning protein